MKRAARSVRELSMLLLLAALLMACMSCRRPTTASAEAHADGQPAAATAVGSQDELGATDSTETSQAPTASPTEAAPTVDGTSTKPNTSEGERAGGSEPEGTIDQAEEAEVAEAEPKDVAIREPTRFSSDPDLSGRERTAEARAAKEDVVKKLFADAGVSYPPEVLFFRVFKEEDELEVWAASDEDDALTHIATYEVCYKSGKAGPKRRQGDSQVPEGFYVLDYYNKRSDFYLSMRVDYPNRLDRVLGEKGNLGSAIMIHGDCVSIGCLAMSDERIQELWVMADDVRRKEREVAVYIFPGRDLEGFIADTSDDTLRAFWTNLKEGADYFEEKRKLPRVGVNKKAGVYTFK